MVVVTWEWQLAFYLFGMQKAHIMQPAQAITVTSYVMIVMVSKLGFLHQKKSCAWYVAIDSLQLDKNWYIWLAYWSLKNINFVIHLARPPPKHVYSLRIEKVPDLKEYHLIQWSFYTAFIVWYKGKKWLQCVIRVLFLWGYRGHIG